MATLSLAVVVTTISILVAIFFTKLIENRQQLRKLQMAKAPMPKFHPIFGHFIALKECMQTLPPDITMHVMVRQISKQFPKGIFYLNLWPFSKPLMIVANPIAAVQVEKAFLDKPRHVTDTMEIINGGPSFMTMHGDAWKKWRGLFNPGFTSGYMTELAPAVTDEVVVFCRLLQEQAKKKEMFQLEEFTLRLTFDVISRVTFGARLHYQTQGSVLADGLRRLVYWTPYGTSFNPFRRWLSPRPLVQKYTSYCINQYLQGEIDKRFDELALSQKASSAKSKSRSIIALAMDEYLTELGEKEGLSKKTFMKQIIPQLRMFLYAGHDTTSSTLLYCYYLLSKHPDILQKVRDEHNNIFDLDFSNEHTQQTINTNPSLLNQLPYTLAVIKEVLRIFPAAASLRDGRPGLFLTDEDGHQYPTENCHIWTLTLVMHHNPNIFIRPSEFIPERWLVGPEDPLYPKKGSWRAFEWGPRACIGKTLAQMELKVALVMTIRMFDITPAYDEWDKSHPKKGIKTVEGDRVYQAEMGGGGAHPVDGYPVRVTLRE